MENGRLVVYQATLPKNIIVSGGVSYSAPLKGYAVTTPTI